MEERTPWSQDRPLPVEASAPTNPLAIWSLVLGLLSYVCLGLLAAVPAVILGHMALGQIRRSGDEQGGKGLAVVGLVLGYANIVLTVLGIVFLVLFMMIGVAAMEAQTSQPPAGLFPSGERTEIREVLEGSGMERPVVADDEEGIRVARRTMEVLAEALEAYRMDMGEYPPEALGLTALLSRPSSSRAWRGPYLKAGQVDPWGNGYVYRDLGTSYQLFSFGPDGEESADDVYLE